MLAIDLTRFAALMEALTAEAETQAVVTETVNGITYYCSDINAEEPEAWAQSLSSELWTNTTDLTIPDTVDLGGVKGIPVTRVMQNLLKDNLSKPVAVTTLTLGKNIDYIYERAFNYSKLETLVLPTDSKLEWIGDAAFSHSPISSIGVVGTTRNRLPAGLTRIFDSCENLTTIDLSETSVTDIGDCAFVRSGLKNIKLPTTSEKLLIDAGAFMNCKSLTSITLPPQLDYMGILAFQGCVNLKTITFEGRFLETGGVGRASFENLAADCTIIAPKPSADKYETVMEAVYAGGWGGSAGAATTKVRWSGETDKGQTAPTNVQVTSGSLTKLEELASDTKNGITVEKNKEGFAAVITITESSGVDAKLTASATVSTNVKAYWSTVESTSVSQRAGEDIVDAVKRYALRSRSTAVESSVALDTSGESGKIVYYVPVATNYGSVNSPETSAVGTPVRVDYIPAQLTASVSTSQNEKVFCGNSTNLYPVSAEPANAFGEENSSSFLYGMRAWVVVPGFGGALDETLANNSTVANSDDGNTYIKYQWYRSATKNTASGTAITAASGENSGYAVCGGKSYWRIGRPTNTQLDSVLKWGPNFLYAEITVKMNGKETTVYTDFTEFYRYDSNFKVKVSPNRGSVNTSTDYKFSGGDKHWAEMGVYKNADRVLTLSLLETCLDEQKLTGYRALMDYYTGCTVKVTPKTYCRSSEVYSKTWHNPDIEAYTFTTSGRSFGAPSELLGTTVLDIFGKTSDTIDAIQLNVTAQFTFNDGVDNYEVDKITTEHVSYVFEWAGIDGSDKDYAYLNNYFSDDLTRWASEQVGGKYFTDWTQMDVPLYSASTGNSFKGNGWYAVLHKVENADQNRGGTPVLFVYGNAKDDTFTLPSKYADLTVVEASVNTDALGLWFDDGFDEVVGAEPGVNYFYWEAVGDTTSFGDYSPVIARFKSSETLATTVRITARQDTAYKISSDTSDADSDAVIPLRLNGTNIGVDSLLSDDTQGHLSYLKVYGRNSDADSWSSAATLFTLRGSTINPFYIDRDSVSTTYTSSGGALLTQTDANIHVTEKAFELYDTDGDGQFQLYFQWDGGNEGTFAKVRASSGTVTVKRTGGKVTMTTEATLGDTKQTDTTIRWNRVSDETEQNTLTITAKAVYDTSLGTAENIVWNGRTSIISTTPVSLSADGQTQDLSNTTVTVSVDKTAKAIVSTLTFTHPSDSAINTITLTPTVRVKDTSGKVVAEAAAPGYTIAINPEANAQSPVIGTNPESQRNYLPNTAVSEAKPLTAYATVSDGGSLTWQ